MKTAGTLLLSRQLLSRQAVTHLVYQINQRANHGFQEKKENALGVSVMATGRVFLSTGSTIEYIIVACTIGLIVKVSSFWLVYG